MFRIMLSSGKVLRSFSQIALQRSNVLGFKYCQNEVHNVVRNFGTKKVRCYQAACQRLVNDQPSRLEYSTQHRHLLWNNCCRRSLQTTSSCYEEMKTVLTPPFAESVSEGDIRWDKAVGDYVKEDEVIGEIETDKTSIQVPAPCSGVITELLVNDGDVVTAGLELMRIKITGDAPPDAAPAAKAEPVAAAPPPPPPPTPAAAPPPPPPAAGPIPTTPPPAAPRPTGPMTSIPVSSVKPIAASAPAPAAAAASTPVLPSGARTEERVKMSRIRQRTAVRLKEAQNVTAMLTTFNEVDMSNVMEMRNQYKDTFLKKHGVKLGFMSAFIKAAATGLTTNPVVNAVIDDSTLEIVYRDYVDISVAVATPKGLVVPVLRNVGGMNYAEIEHGLSELGEKARLGRLAVEDMDGGTFTISNGGVFGSMFGTPIINPPQSAILGMHAIFERPMAIKGKIEIRPMMYVALTYDHRLIDGREAVTFLKKIKSGVEDPRTLLMDM
ncbi:dihydrolipoyllysine-residue succinyltransferase component of 2-oxoglutarate dehydrogenase complex, mitochondrial-like [Amphiura filiformis]|uniref:dihydrolipoyllysine-residue succinyltransferase component of 2-oxoglutarate dehydrogenase complex, mitochondrial-like n=1 Tax=Amphiura filiformis TaxID=82378 RepID=UPI003B226684